MLKVSIIIPVYNTEKYIERCIESALNQTLKDIEIIVINDGSTDNSKQIINNYKSKDNRIRTVHFNTNHGVSIARNLGINLAKGEFVGFIDSDDYVDLKYFEELYNYSKEYDIIRGIRVINGKHGKNEYGCIIPSIIRKSILDEHKRLRFPIGMNRGEDSTFKRWLYKTTQKIFECPDNGIYYHYMKREGSLSNYTLTDKKE